MKYFLAKTEPSTYSIDDFAKDRETVWDGVHNYAAILFIRQMQLGDMVFIYHSMKGKNIVGIAEVVGDPYLNKNDPRHSWAVTLKLVKKFNGPTLSDFKKNPEFVDFSLVRQSRLSVMPVAYHIAEWILSFQNL